MKNFSLRVISVFLLLLLLLGFAACKPSDSDDEPLSVSVLGIPTEARYPDGDAARCAWDMILYEGKIFMGSGDYDKNKGPAEIWSYDPKEAVFTLTGTVPDEEVDRFTLIDGKLTTPGIDPKEDWTLGNYYVYEDGKWVTHRRVPGGIHMFDIVEFDGAIFTGIGVVEGESPIAASFDGGESFRQLSFIKKGETLDTKGRSWIRVYDLFVYEDTLYAALSLEDGERAYELYFYDPEKEAFVFETDLADVFQRAAYKYAKIGEKVIFDGTLFLTTGYLYSTIDMLEFEKTEFPRGVVVTDLYVANDTLYALTSVKDPESGQFKTAVYALTSSDGMFDLAFEFSYDIPAMSMVVDGSDFYIGMGNGRATHAKNGTLLHVSLPTK